MSSLIAIIDYDMGNLHSVCKALEKVGATPKITDSPQEIAEADAIVLPGVGSFDPAMEHLEERNLISVIKEIALRGKPFLGICLGLQILFESSEEGKKQGLGIFKGQVKRFRSEADITIPHMGWNTLNVTQSQHHLWDNLPVNPSVYFVHSYYVAPIDHNVIASQVTHGTQTVTASIAQDNLMAVQFHPEKSADIGLQILTNFVALTNKN